MNACTLGERDKDSIAWQLFFYLNHEAGDFYWDRPVTANRLPNMRPLS